MIRLILLLIKTKKSIERQCCGGKKITLATRFLPCRFVRSTRTLLRAFYLYRLSVCDSHSPYIRSTRDDDVTRHAISCSKQRTSRISGRVIFRNGLVSDNSIYILFLPSLARTSRPGRSSFEYRLSSGGQGLTIRVRMLSNNRSSKHCLVLYILLLLVYLRQTAI